MRTKPRAVNTAVRRMSKLALPIGFPSTNVWQVTSPSKFRIDAVIDFVTTGWLNLSEKLFVYRKGERTHLDKAAM